ncbi:MAG TPA: hypothetical protein VGQ13_06515 [Nitrososphaera sp.]|nr:hypothetical protein [Nitrososphaera sp.]
MSSPRKEIKNEDKDHRDDKDENPEQHWVGDHRIVRRLIFFPSCAAP